MSKFFDVEDNKVTVNPQILKIKVFGDIWNKDKSKDKAKANAELSFIYFYTDFDSPYFSYDEKERLEQIKEYVLMDKTFTITADIQKALDVYKELNISPAMKMLEAATSVVTKMEKYFKNVDFTEKDDAGKLLYDIKEITDVITKLPKLTESLNQAKELCKKESTSSIRVRGNADTGLFEN